MPPVITLSARVPPEIKAAFQREAERRGCPVSALLLMVVTQWLSERS